MKRLIILTLLLATTMTHTIAQNRITADDLNARTFPVSEKVEIRRVSFYNRLGINLIGDLYIPRGADLNQKHAAIIVGHPFGGSKEQSSGLYAQTMAERGFVALAFDLSRYGESGGQQHGFASPEGFAEDFSAAVDFIGTRKFVDRGRIGVIGICGSGCFSIAAASVDPRIKALVTVSMYDMGRATRQGVNDYLSIDDRKAILEQVALQRWAEAEGEPIKFNAGTPQYIDDKSDPVAREFFDYYRTPRGQHPRVTTETSVNSTQAFMLFFPFEMIETISPRPLLFIAGENAHSRYFSEDAYRRAAEPKELLIVKDANHVDLYDRTDKIPFDKIADFFTQSLPRTAQPTTEPMFGLGTPVTDNFTGDAWLSMLSSQDGYDCSTYNVTFAPSTRNYWHKHSVGQILLCTEGVGYYQEQGKDAKRLTPGSVVEIPAGAIHWHGAAPDESFTHVGITPRASDNKVEWMGEVTEDQYKNATAKQ